MKVVGKKTLFFSILILLLGGGVYYFHYHKSQSKPEPTVTVTEGDITEEAEAIGYIKPRHLSTVKSQIDGKVAEIYHYEGEYVKKDQPLIAIQPQPAPAEYAGTYESLVSAQAEEKAAQRNLIRFEQAKKKGVISGNYADYIAAKKEYDTTKVARILAEQRLALIDVGKTQVAQKEIANIVLSPIDGYILTRAVDVGDPVISLSSAQSATALFTIANMQDLMFQGTVDEKDAAKLSLGLEANITIGSFVDKKIVGTLSKIALQSDKENTAQGVANKGTDTDSPFNVGFCVEATDLKITTDLGLRSGYSATAKIKIKTAKKVLLLPERVLQFKDNKTYVLLPSADPKQKPQEREVVVGITDTVNAEIKSGVALGDKVLDTVVTKSDEEE